jgi:aminoglycoside phosphotransferase family enzyme/predicted kinase
MTVVPACHGYPQEMVTITAAQDTVVPGFTPSELLTPSAFPHAIDRLAIRETNLSWVILTGPYAYKIKKSVELNFIDTSTLETRRHLCEEELRLNQRQAADLYMDVIAITRDADGVRVGGHGGIIEYAVRMKQFDSSEELSALLERGTVSTQDIVDFAERVAEFHASAPRAPCALEYLHTEHLHDAVLGNLAILLSHLDADTRLPEIGSLIDWTHDFLHDSLTHLHTREQSGFIRECHGDLHARNVVRWRGRLIPFDCLEFDPKLRWIDVMSDVAFMVMDLGAHGRRDLEFSFLNSYLEHTGDYDGVRLLPFYAVYRALVRAMVDSLGAEHDLDHREEFCRRLRMRVKTASAFIRGPAPALLIMHGPSGSGKSSLSERLAARLGAVRIRSDLERKRLAGVRSADVRDRGFERGIYTPEFSHRTYARLLECTEGCLKGGVNVIVDAAFLDGADRRLFRALGAQQAVQHVIVSCKADRSVLTKRIEMRQQSHVDPSEADVAVLDRQLQSLEPLSAGERGHVIEVDTSQARAYEKALTAIQNRLADCFT